MLAVAILMAVASVAIVYGYLRSQSVRKIQGDLIQILPPENCLSWRIPEKPTVISDSTQLALRETGGKGDANDATNAPPIVFPNHSPNGFDPGTIDWMATLSLSAAAFDGLVQIAPLIVEFDEINLGALKHGVEKTIDLISKAESFDVHFGHLMVAAEHGHEAWLGAVGAYLAKHMAVSGMDHAVSAKAAMADMTQHAGLSAAEAHNGVAEGVLHGASSSEHVGFLADAHFPVITVLFSSYREFQLLADDKTTFLRAAKNVAVDGAAVAGGGLLGAKAGAAAGTLFAPVIGTIVGGILGGIVGSVAGKFGATSVRFSRFESAKSAYLATADKAKQDVNSLIQRSQADAKQMHRQGSKEFEEGRAVLIQEAHLRLSAEVARYQSRVHELTEAFPQRLGQLARQLEDERRSILETIPETMCAFLWPTRSDVMRGMVNDWFHRAADLLADEISRYRDLPDRSTNGRAAEIKRFLKAYRFQLDQLDVDIREVVDAFDKSKVRAKEIESFVLTQVESLRQRLINQFTVGIARMTDNIARETEKRKEEIQQLWGALKIEADAVGISLMPEHG